MPADDRESETMLPKSAVSIHELLSNRLPTEELQIVSLVLMPFLSIGKARYPLAAVDRLDPADISDAINSAAGPVCRNVSVVSQSDVLELPQLSHTLPQLLRSAHDGQLGGVFPKEVFDSLFYNILGRLTHSVSSTIKCEDLCQRGIIIDLIGLTLTLYIQFMIVGDKQLAQQLIPLIELLPSCLPIGELPSEPGTWLALGA